LIQVGTIRGKSLNSSRDVRDENIAGRADGDSLRIVELSNAMTIATPLADERAARGKFLNTVVSLIRYVDATKPVDGSSQRRNKLSRQLTEGAPRCDQVAIGGKAQDTVIVRVDYEDIPELTTGDTVGRRAGARSGEHPLSEKIAIGVEDLNPAATRINHMNQPSLVHCDVTRRRELPGSYSK
jgi:hypothetical protein